MKDTIEAGKHFVYNNIEFVCLETFSKNVYENNAVLAVATNVVATAMPFNDKSKDGCNN